MSAGNNEKYSRLETVLQCYGADDQKWPTDDREDLRDFVRGDDKAQALLTSCQALADCLNFGKVVVKPSEEKALLAKIMMKIPDDAAPMHEVSANRSRVSYELKAGERVEKPFTEQLLKIVPLMQKRLSSESHLAQISLFAGSLFLGLFIGLMLTSNSFWEQAIQVAFLDNGIVVEQSFEDVLMGVDVL